MSGTQLATRSAGARRAIPAAWEGKRQVEWLTLAFPAPPSANNLFFNAPGRGRVKSTAYSNWLREAGYIAAASRAGCVRGPYAITIRIRRASLRRDLSNYTKAIEDLLVSLGAVEDDRHCQSIDIAWADEGEGVTVKVVATKGSAA